jgi:hypothetical protein
MQDGMVPRPSGLMKLTSDIRNVDVVHIKRDDSYHVVLREDGISLKCTKAQAQNLMQRDGKNRGLLTCIFECPEIFQKLETKFRLLGDDYDFFHGVDGEEIKNQDDVEIDREAIEESIESYVVVSPQFSGRLVDLFVDDSPRNVERDDLRRYLQFVRYPPADKDPEKAAWDAE